MVLWFFLPLTLGPVQDFVAYFFAGDASKKSTASPVIAAYWVAGSFSAAIHICVVCWAWLSPELSVSRIYWPNHGLVQPGIHMLVEGAMVFMQYDLVVIALCVAALGVYQLGFDKVLAAQTTEEKLSLGAPLLTVLGVTLVGGPGAGIAWLMCIKEKELEAENAVAKQS